MKATRLDDGVYRVDHGDRTEIVYVAGPPEDRWAFWNGQTYRVRSETQPRRSARSDTPLSLTAPMPATVLKVLTHPGATVKKGDTVLILEAMKMELPIRAPADASVTAVHCREGELVQPDVVLVELR
jgi:3-methylcrotonyl-CoA carboxylase alpha subunit